jgi:translation initiation factor 3 subunit M
MPGTSKTLLIEGSFTELAEEFAQYIDNVKNDGSTLSSDIAQPISALSQLQREEQETGELNEDQTESMRVEVMKTLVTACPALNSAPEKGTDIHTLYFYSAVMANTSQNLRLHTTSLST